MKKALILLLLVTPSLVKAQHTHSEMKNEIDSLSYALGMNVASSLKNGGIDTMNYAIFLEAMKDVIAYNHVKMDGTTSNQIVNGYMGRAKEAKATQAAAEGVAFLAENSKRPEVKVTPSGLQYEIIKKGDGPIPVDGQRVKTHYEGTLINGKKFDSSYDRGSPATFGVNQVIKGWIEALKMMPTGSKWKLYIPQELAYGERGAGANIPPYAALVFTIELIEIVQ